MDTVPCFLRAKQIPVAFTLPMAGYTRTSRAAGRGLPLFVELTGNSPILWVQQCHIVLTSLGNFRGVPITLPMPTRNRIQRLGGKMCATHEKGWFHLPRISRPTITMVYPLHCGGE
uniref:Uncharacterized protein n=1 Tax=Trypanosoma congolense (strain IL3000) TaxID=1068625 RepID=G0URP6_TRYCI|nr:hypothetical protein, unlikely [Trypanosoma congolense IL3000]